MCRVKDLENQRIRGGFRDAMSRPSRVHLQRRLRGQTWGAIRHRLFHFYKRFIRPVLENGALLINRTILDMLEESGLPDIHDRIKVLRDSAEFRYEYEAHSLDSLIAGLSCSLQHDLTVPTIDECVKTVTQASQFTMNIKSCEELAQGEKSMRQGKRERRAEKEKTKGQDWFNLPAPEMNESLRNDLKLLQMRQVLDPKRFYKGPDIRGALPKYFQMARVVETAADFYSGRIPKKQRKRTLVDELLADDEFRRYNKRKYEELQAKQPRGLSKAYEKMKKLKKRKK